jgi:hypothetical protein
MIKDLILKVYLPLLPIPRNCIFAANIFYVKRFALKRKAQLFAGLLLGWGTMINYL